MAVEKIWSSLKPNSNFDTYVGENGEIFFNPTNGELRISDGVTPGGLPIATQATAENAQKLNNQPGSYYLDYDNFTNTPSNLSDFNNDQGFITASDVQDYVGDDVTIELNSPNEFSVINVPNVTLGPVQGIKFDITHEQEGEDVGTLCWNPADDSLNIQHSNGVVQQVGQEQYVRVANNTGVTITNGQCVRFDGAAMNGEAYIEVAPFRANGVYPSLYGLGIATQDIDDGEKGYVTVWGKVRDLNTTGGAENWTAGTILYASPDVAGALTKVKPTAPNNVVPVAAVLVADATAGELFVRPTVEQKMSYGVFTRTTDLDPNQTNTAFTVGLDNTEISNGVSIGSPASRLIVDQSGLYQIDVTAHFNTTGGTFDEDTWYLWLRKNGNDVANTMRRGGIDGEIPNGVSPSFTRVLSLDADDYVEICIAVSSTDIDLEAVAATAFGPSTAALEVSVSQIQL